MPMEGRISLNKDLLLKQRRVPVETRLEHKWNATPILHFEFAKKILRNFAYSPANLQNPG